MKRGKKKLMYIFICIFCVLVGVVFGGISVYKSYIRTEAIKSYNYWKKHYVIQVSDNVSRVVNPQDNNVTVSEGIGYGMLLSVAADDSTTFNKLWNYAKLHSNANGLMDWKVDSNGNVIGKGSASDADQDMAYALLIASKKWLQRSYLNDSKKMIDAIAKHEINSSYVLLPGDSWGQDLQFNPSYIAPAYYEEFASVSQRDYWQKVSSVNIQLLNKIANKETGLLPDWINQNGTIIEKKNIFGYDAIRVPIRLLQFYKVTKESVSEDILQRQYKLFSRIGINNLCSGYAVTGDPIAKYINSAYLSSFAAISCIRPYSQFNIKVIDKLISTSAEDYYGDSLKVWTLFVITNRL